MDGFEIAAGSAHLVLAENVVHLDPGPAVFEAMLQLALHLRRLGRSLAR